MMVIKLNVGEESFDILVGNLAVKTIDLVFEDNK